MKPELRTTQGENARPLLVRTADGTESRVIEGYAIVWGVESQILCEGFGVFIEIIDRGALTPETLATFDIRFLLEHNPNRLLARWREGNGTLACHVCCQWHGSPEGAVEGKYQEEICCRDKGHGCPDR